VASLGGKRLLQAAAAAGLLGLLLLLVRVPIGEPPREAMLRFAGRMVGEKIRVCRELTPAERAKIPLHMQTAGKRCEQSMLPYRLDVWVDETPRVDLEVHPAGLRGDRPVYVQRDLLLPPGPHRVRVRFDPETLPAPAAGAPSATDAEQRRALESAARDATRYPLDQVIELQAGQVVLVELNEQARRWEVRGGGR